MKKDNLGDRMKNYENVNKHFLTKRMPTIIRVDGRAFHSLTKNLIKPFDDIFMNVMKETAKYLCENIQGCKLAYIQSDEISLLLIDDDTIMSEAWFNKNLQKMVSISASMSTLAFNKNFTERIKDYEIYLNDIWRNMEKVDLDEHEYYLNNYKNKINTAMFDSRAFVLPKEEVCNYFIWRQQDATRNAIQMIGQTYFKHKELHGVNCNQIQDKLFVEKGINFNDFPISQKRGSCVIKEERKVNVEIDLINAEPIIRYKWIIDENIPIFTQDRNYINQYLNNYNEEKMNE